jgi:hypothetical protein
MCTVSFLPTKSGFILSSTRDERALRKSAVFPSYQESKSGSLILPRDGEAGGTWICLASTKMICLLNGAFQKHKHQPPYKHSRGKVVLDAFDFDNFETFLHQYNFENIEPHTLVLVDFTQDLKLTEMRWDGKTAHVKPLNAAKTYIWSSCTLYPDEVIANRKHLFKNWVDNANTFTPDNAEDFHLNTKVGDSKNDFRMKREDSLQTISFTQVVCEYKKATMVHKNLV